jgi:hypothetical protein
MSSKVMSRQNIKDDNIMTDEEIIPVLRKDLDAYAKKMLESKENYKRIAYTNSKEKEVYKRMMEELKSEYTKIAEKLQEIEERNKIQKKVQKINNITDVSLNFDDELKEFNEKCKRDADIEAEKQLKELRKMFKKF